MTKTFSPPNNSSSCRINLVYFAFDCNCFPHHLFGFISDFFQVFFFLLVRFFDLLALFARVICLRLIISAGRQ